MDTGWVKKYSRKFTKGKKNLTAGQKLKISSNVLTGFQWISDSNFFLQRH